METGGQTTGNDNPIDASSGDALDDRTGDMTWARSFGEATPLDLPSSDTASDSVEDIAIDAQGNLYVTGLYHGTLTIEDSEYISAGGSDIWIASFTAGGALRWSTAFGTPGHDSRSGIEIAPSGAVVIAGGLSGDPGFGDGPWGSSFQAYVAIVDPMTGSITNGVGLPSDESSYFLAATVGAAGEIYAAGAFAGSINLDQQYDSVGEEDAMVVQFDSSLQLTTAWVDGKPGDDLAKEVTISSSGKVAIGGHYAQGDGSLHKSIFVSLFPQGLLSGHSGQWNVGSNDNRISKVHRIKFINDEDVVVTGFVNKGTHVGQTEPSQGGPDDAFVARLDMGGNIVWAHTFGGEANDSALGLAIDNDGDIIVAGRTSDTDNLLGLPVSMGDGPRLFTLKLEGDGTPLWAHRFVGTDYSSLESLVVDEMGNGYAGGAFSGSISLAGTTLNAVEGSDALLVSFER